MACHMDDTSVVLHVAQQSRGCNPFILGGIAYVLVDLMRILFLLSFSDTVDNLIVVFFAEFAEFAEFEEVLAIRFIQAI